MILVPFEFSSHYPEIDGSNWFNEDIQWIIDKFFEESQWFKWRRHFPYFSTDFLVFSLI